jgi:dolichol-phosphate mannosyltransferase
MSLLGLLTAGLSICYGVYVIVSHFHGGSQVRGYASMVALLTFLLGLVMMMLGIIGEYVWRILDESRNRPGEVVDDVYE